MNIKAIACLGGLLVTLALPVCGLAQAGAEEADGFFGHIMVGGGLASARPDQLTVTDDNKRLDHLKQRADRETELIPLLMGEFGYAFGRTGTTISLGIESDEERLASLEVSQSLGKLGTLSSVLAFGSTEVWKDPYLTGVRRSRTDQSTVSLEVAYQEIMGSGAMASARITSIDVDDDHIGSRQRHLRRDGTKLATAGGYVFRLNDNHTLIPRAEIELDHRDGRSNTSLGGRIEATHIWSPGAVTFETTLAYGEKEFDKDHPVFNRTRKEQTFAVSELITYAEPFGWQDISLHVLAAYSRTEANIDFFDSDALLVGAGLGYSF